MPVFTPYGLLEQVGGSRLRQLNFVAQGVRVFCKEKSLFVSLHRRADLMQRNIYGETKYISFWVKSLCWDEYLHPTRRCF